MNITKKSKNAQYDDPSAFSKQFPRIDRVDGVGTLLGKITNETVYKMGKLRVTVSEPTVHFNHYFMSVHCRDRYPTWDEMVWLRYNLIPDAAEMAMILPSLNRYINREDSAYKFVFTMEQKSWLLDPEPLCTHCNQPLLHVQTRDGFVADYACRTCDHGLQIDLRTWNEEHGNGFMGKHF